MSTINRIRSAIAESHDSIEKTPFSIAMMSDFISASDYARGLSQLWRIHWALETGMKSSEEVSDFLIDEMCRTETIKRDLRSLKFCTHSFSAMSQTDSIVKQISHWAKHSPHALIGCLYILEGSRMGSLVIARPLSKALGIPSGEIAGLEYHVEGAAGTPARVRALKERIDTMPFSISQTLHIVDGAVQFMSMLNELYAAIPVAQAIPSCHFDPVPSNCQRV
ncbi:MAG: biliverdin-producing heme oxygenase [Planctomycetota bacterium]|nr:biliverdin-producing heme oxygenase [Planctomycetota bacterium]